MKTHLDPFGFELFEIEDAADEIETGDPLDEPDRPEQEWPSPEQLAAEAGCELPF